MDQAQSEMPVATDYSVRITPDRPWYDLGLRESWRYRSLLATLTWRDVRVRYKQSILGILWVILKPFLSLVVFSMIFGKLAKLDSEGAPYPIFLYSGLLAWNLFNSVATAMGQSVVANRNVINRVYVPCLILPLASAGSRFVDFLAALSILFGLIFFYDSIGFSWSMLAVIPLTFLTLVTAAGVGLAFAPLTAAYRDFGYISGYFFQILMYLTPVVYSVTIIPGKWQWVMMLNPMAGIVDAQRSAILGKPFAWGNLLVSCVVSLAIFTVGLLYYRRMDRHFADIA
jgi:lipopolysaccharide transport system permease protein